MDTNIGFPYSGNTGIWTLWEGYMLQIVTEENIEEAALIHQLSWKESHQSFCSKEFIDAHTTSTQMEYIRNELLKGKRFFLLNLNEEGGKGIVSVHHNLIENLYVLPDQQRKGYGTVKLFITKLLKNERDYVNNIFRPVG